jgi:hypothetical protein
VKWSLDRAEYQSLLTCTPLQSGIELYSNAQQRVLDVEAIIIGCIIIATIAVFHFIFCVMAAGACMHEIFCLFFFNR